tara:strand:+ start:2298 stop:3149 length:852 start_codon:yes stop_codon:yes gene_type:complete
MENTTETAVQTDIDAPVTDSASSVDNNATDTKSDLNTTPKVEQRDGKTYIDGQRIYSRDDVNKIGANAKREVESRLLQELNVDSIENVKQVINTLQDSSDPQGTSLNVDSLRDAVKKREATVEELQNQVKSLRTDLMLKDHLGQLNNAMPSAWNADQKGAVVDLMKARGMLAVEGDTFAIRSGDSYLTTHGETPDYNAAVELVGKTLGLNFGKKGVDLQYGETSTDVSGRQTKPLNEERLVDDAEYRAAYMNIRQYQPNVSRSAITDTMVKKSMETRRSKITY